MNRNQLRNKKWYNSAVAILIGVVGYVCLTHLNVLTSVLSKISTYFTAVFFGAVMAYLINPLAVALQNKVFRNIKKDAVKWGLSICVAMLAVIMLFFFLLMTLIPQLIESTFLLVNNMNTYVGTFTELIQDFDIPGFDIETQMDEIAASSGDLIKTLTQLLSTNLKGLVTASRDVGKTIVNVFLAFILSFYLLGSKESIKNGCKRLLKAALPIKWYDNTITYANRCNSILVRYIVFSLLDAVIVGGANAVFMAFMKMEYIGLISVIAGVTNLIPSFGPMIGGAIGGFILLLVNPWHALFFILFTLVLQTLDGYVIKPKLFGNSLGVSGLLILIAIIVFGNILGVVGILLAIPLAAIIDFTYEEYFLPYLEARRARLNAEEEREKSILQRKGIPQEAQDKELPKDIIL